VRIRTARNFGYTALTQGVRWAQRTRHQDGILSATENTPATIDMVTMAVEARMNLSSALVHDRHALSDAGQERFRRVL
jgi:hypothetical protein